MVIKASRLFFILEGAIRIFFVMLPLHAYAMAVLRDATHTLQRSPQVVS